MSSLINSIGDLFEEVQNISSKVTSSITNWFSIQFDNFIGYFGLFTNLLDVISREVANWSQSIFDSLDEVLSYLDIDLYGLFGDISQKLFYLPDLITNGIQNLFVPNTDDLENTFKTAVNTISSKLGIQQFDLDALSDKTVVPDDVESDYNIHGVGTFKLKFFDTKYLIQGVEYFRPFIRGFIVLLLVLFNWRQLLGFIGHDLGATAYGYASTQDKGEKD